MKTYRVSTDHGTSTPIFQVDAGYIARSAIAVLLENSEGVDNVNASSDGDIIVRFKYKGCPFIVWEPYGDNSRYWIGPADMVQGEPDVPDPPDTVMLEERFKEYRPPLLRAMISGLLNLDFVTAAFKRKPRA